VAATGDDGYAIITSSTLNTTGNESYFGCEGTPTYRGFFRFTDVSIPVGATITSAVIRMRCRGSLSGTTVNAKVHCEAADSPTAPTTYSDLAGRSLTTGTEWNNVGSWTVGSWYDSPSIISDVQAVIDRAGWIENNALTVHIINNSSSGSAAYRNPGTRNYSVDYAAKLVVTYTPPAGSVITEQVAANGDDGYLANTSFDASSDSTILGNLSGIICRGFFRFTNVSIPVGATIVAAKIQTRCYDTLSGATCNLKVHCEAADSPTAPTSNSDLTGRSLTTGTEWNAVSGQTSGTWYDSPDIKSDVQEVVNRGGWADNNALTIHILNNGSSSNAYRQSRSRNYATGDAAKLVVTYTV
jgi:type IV pilus assembly protein PilY1